MGDHFWGLSPLTWDVIYSIVAGMLLYHYGAQWGQFAYAVAVIILQIFSI